jgi:uncharacterized protein (TIGR03790 family)
MLKWFVWLSLVFVACRVLAADDAGRRVLIVYNAEEPESKPLADYYASKRGVPTNQICEIRVRNVDTITRREFNDQIREPILRFLTRNGLMTQEPRMVDDPMLGRVPSLETVDNKISYVVLMYGVPLRLDNDSSLASSALPTNVPAQFKRTEASVESELSLLPWVNPRIIGWVANPFFESTPPFGPPLNRAMMLVGRLDGPDPSVVRRMIDDAIATEHYGLLGRAYFDAQGIRDKGYAEGDNWIRTAYEALRDAGFECDFDGKPEVFNQDYPMTDVAVYAGWYASDVTGPFRREDFRFRHGAVAYHIHSWSAASVHTRTSYWVGPLLAKGAAVTMGNVHEPYLQYTPHVDVFFKRLLAGTPFLEAGYASQPVLSWQTTFDGDPLYRPFALSLDEQIARLEADKNPDVAWAYVRKVNLLLARGKTAEAEKFCRAKAKEFPSIVLDEKLADVLSVMHHETEAIAIYNKLIDQANGVARTLRLTMKLASAYERSGKPALALAVYEGLITANLNSKNVAVFYTKARDLAFAAGAVAKSQSYQAKLDALARGANAAEKK